MLVVEISTRALPTPQSMIQQSLFVTRLGSGTQSWSLPATTGILPTCCYDNLLADMADRVGILGFLATKDLVDVNGHVGNFGLSLSPVLVFTAHCQGLHDCIKMFEWTRKNIAAFGGDPNNVTAIGESAGAFAISMLLHSQRRLFQKVILESGSQMVMVSVLSQSNT